MTDVQIVLYEPRHAEAFRDLNLAWIEEYFRVEDVDRQVLDDPDASILEKGGAILVAEQRDAVVGVCALLHHSPGRFEVSKMAVRKDLRGHGLGRRLLSEMIARAPQLGARQLYIISNTALGPAIHLYRQLGFREIPLPPDQKYARGNIALELDLA